jgi:hypothetical protein
VSRFLYFVPQVCPSEAAGLPDIHPKRLLAGETLVIRGTTDGPGGEPGCVVMLEQADDAERQVRCGYYPEKQTWKPYEGFHLGWETNNKPTPADLMRSDAVGGDPVTLADKQPWLLPLLGPAWRELPSILKGTADGGCIAVLHDKYLPLCKESEWWFDVALAQTPYMLSRFLKFASDALATNYYVGVQEVSELGLILTDQIQHSEVLLNVLGVVRADQESKKNGVAGGLAAPSETPTTL